MRDFLIALTSAGFSKLSYDMSSFYPTLIFLFIAIYFASRLHERDRGRS